MKYLKLTTLFLILLTIQTFSQESNNGRLKIGLNLGVNQSDLKAIVKQTYFNGNNWMVEVIYKGNSVFIEHNSYIATGMEISFKIVS
jgi:hypothetical protein